MMAHTADIVPFIPLSEQLGNGDSPTSMALRRVTTVAEADEANERQAAIESADRHITREYPAVAALLEENGRDQARQHPEHKPLLAAAETTLVRDDGLGAHRTAPIESTTREIVDSGPAELPWLAAEIVVSDYRSQAYGRRTQLWLHNNCDTAELTVAEARAKLRDARAFLDRFEALIDHAEPLAAGDFEGDPEVYAAEREAEDRRIKAIDEARLARAAALLAEVRA